MLDLMWRKLVSESTPSETSMDKCERLLREVEKSGMLPPRAELIIAGQTFHDHYWEPEEGGRSGAV